MGEDDGETGGEIRTSCPPRQIITEKGRVIGVETAKGEFIPA